MHLVSFSLLFNVVSFCNVNTFSKDIDLFHFGCIQRIHSYYINKTSVPKFLVTWSTHFFVQKKRVVFYSYLSFILPAVLFL